MKDKFLSAVTVIVGVSAVGALIAVSVPQLMRARMSGGPARTGM